VRVLLFILLLFAPAPFSEGADALETTFSRAAAALSRGDLPAAEQGFDAVLKSQPNHVGAMGNLGVIYSRSGRTHQAIAIYRRALKVAPNDMALLVNLGLAYLKEENHSAAKQVFEPLVKRDPSNARLRELLATTQVYTGESDKALASLEQLPRTPNTIYLMGLANLRAGNREKARELLDEAFPAAMSPAQAAFMKGKAYYDATLFDDAIREFRKARALDESLPGVRMELARALVSIRDNDAAEGELRGLLKAQPSDADACYLLGALLVQEGKETEAVRLLEIARAARPDGWGAYYYLGRAKLQIDDARSAAPLLKKAADMNPEESAVFYHLSRALKALGRDAEARKAAARVAELKRQGVQRDQDAVILR
jgi:predicted Zn-dependent protease